MTEAEVKLDLDYLKQLHSTVIEHKLVKDTVVLLNKKMNEGKRVLVEDCSSSLMDVDTGIYPYCDSFNTTVGSVCLGLGVPEEAIETTIGVFSATSIVRRAFLNRIRRFPTEISKEDPSYESIKNNLETDYDISESKNAFGWLDLNLIKHSHTINNLSSLYLTGLDVLDDLDEIKICKKYKFGDEVIDGTLPALIDDFGLYTPEYKTMKGWK